MDKKTKYLILFSYIIIVAIANILIIQNIWRFFYSTLFAVFIFDQLEQIGSVKLTKSLCCLMILSCFIDCTLSLLNNDWIHFYVSLAFLLFLIAIYLKTLLRYLARLSVMKEYAQLTLEITNFYKLIYGKDKYILYLKGNALNFQEKFEKALECLEESKMMGYDSPSLYHHMGCACFYLENYEKAYEFFKLSADGNPENFIFLSNISQITFLLEKYEESLHYIEKALKLDEKNEEIISLKKIVEEEMEINNIQTNTN